MTMVKTKTLQPLIKWPGGKASELPHLQRFFPEDFKDFYEPFLGGGACYFASNFEHAYVNDKCPELINFYLLLKNKNKTFFKHIKAITKSWALLETWVTENKETIIESYKADKPDWITVLIYSGKEEFIQSIAELTSWHKDKYFEAIEKTLNNKLLRMKKLEATKGALNKEDILKNVEGALKSGLYNHIRALYNSSPSMILKTSSFVFLREYCYSAMFRYSKSGKFNVPYGGISYNSRSPDSKVASWKNTQLLEHLDRTTFEALDFADFIEKHEPGPEDFVFLDPPYDTEFSTYAGNPFGQNDQERLANWLIDSCQAKWLLVIKNTDFIYKLYHNKPGVTIDVFDKRYAVSFKNRNNPNCKHLIITGNF